MSRREATIASLGLCLLLSTTLGLTGCTQTNGRPIIARGNADLPLLTMDELARVDGRSLTLSQFAVARSLLRSSSPKVALQHMITAMALQNSAGARGVDVPLEIALRVSQFAQGGLAFPEAEPSLQAYFGTKGTLSPQVALREVTTCLRSAIIQENSALIAELR